VQESGIVQVFGRRRLDFMGRGARLSSHDLTDSGLKVATESDPSISVRRPGVAALT
jgi:hypothetical protein